MFFIFKTTMNRLSEDLIKIIAHLASGKSLRGCIDVAKIDWKFLSENSNDEAVALLKANPSKIDWTFLSGNSNDGAVDLLKANPSKISWGHLSGNSNDWAFELLKANPSEIDWPFISLNSGIFKSNWLEIFSILIKI